MPVNFRGRLRLAPLKYAAPAALTALVKRQHPGARDVMAGPKSALFIDRTGRIMRADYTYTREWGYRLAAAEDTSTPASASTPSFGSWLRAAASVPDLEFDSRDYCAVPPPRFPAASRDYGGPSTDPRVLAASMARQHDAEFSTDDYMPVPAQRYGGRP